MKGREVAVVLHQDLCWEGSFSILKKKVSSENKKKKKRKETNKVDLTSSFLESLSR